MFLHVSTVHAAVLLWLTTAFLLVLLLLFLGLSFFSFLVMFLLFLLLFLLVCALLLLHHWHLLNFSNMFLRWWVVPFFKSDQNQKLLHRNQSYDRLSRDSSFARPREGKYCTKKRGLAQPSGLHKREAHKESYAAFSQRTTSTAASLDLWTYLFILRIQDREQRPWPKKLVGRSSLQFIGEGAWKAPVQDKTIPCWKSDHSAACRSYPRSYSCELNQSLSVTNEALPFCPPPPPFRGGGAKWQSFVR